MVQRTFKKNYFASLPIPHGLVVLYVEDEVEIACVVGEIIERALPQVSFLHAGDGFAALRLLEKLTPSLIILDFFLPVMDGDAIYDEIRCLPHLRAVPVVVFSGYADSRTIGKMLARGLSGFLSKPSIDREIVCFVQKHLHLPPDSGGGIPVLPSEDF